MVNLVKPLIFSEVRNEEPKEDRITGLPNDILQVIFKIIDNLKDFRQIRQVSKFFSCTSIFAPLEEAFGSSAKEIYATASAIKQRAIQSFKNYYLFKETCNLSNSWNIADLQLLKKGTEARDAFCVWRALREKIAEPADLHPNSLKELIEKRREFSPWCTVHETKLQQVTGLDLHAQNLTSFPPECCEKLTGLRSLILSKNALASLPPEMGKLTQLQHLYVEGNSQLTSVPPEFENLKGLNIPFLRDLNPDLKLSLVELGIIDKWDRDLLVDTWYGFGGYRVADILDSKLLDNVEKIPIFGILSGVVRIVIAIALIAFNTLKAIGFGLAVLGGLCLSDKKIERVMRMAAIDSGWAIVVNLGNISRGILGPILSPIYYFVIEPVVNCCLGGRAFM